MRVLVTGGTGFLGRHIVAELLEAGHEVTAIARSLGGDLLPARAAFAAADVRNPGSLRSVVKNIDAVCHAAGIPRTIRPTPEREALMYQTNAEGTRNVCRAAASAGVKRIVVISSITVYGSGCKRPAVEQDDCRPDDAYATSKLRAEQFAEAASAEFGLRVSVLRFGPLYGPGHNGNVRRLINAIERRRFYPFGRGRNRKSLLHVHDAARASRLAVERNPKYRECFSIFNVAGPPVTMREIVDAAANALGRLPYRSYIPALPFTLLWRIGLCPHAIERWLADEPIDSTRFSHTFGWRPEVSLVEGFRDEAAELRDGFALASWGRGACR